MKSYRDIFDPLLDWPILKIFKQLYFKFKDELLYLFWGFVNFLISFGSFYAIHYGLGISESITNVISWIITVVTGYFLFAIFVFKEHNTSIKEEFIKFASGRIFSLIVSEIITVIFSNVFHIEAWITKIVCEVIVTILNYIISKFFVFK